MYSRGEESAHVRVCGGGDPKRARAAVTQVCLCFEGCKSLQECIGMDWQQSRTNALDQLMGGGGLSQLLIPVLERGKEKSSSSHPEKKRTSNWDISS